MVSFERIKQHFADLTTKGENAPSTAKLYTNTIHKVLDDLDCDLSDIADCINHRVVNHILRTYAHVGTRQGVLVAFLKAIDTCLDLEAEVTPFVRDQFHEQYEIAKTAAKERSIQNQLTEKVERFDSIVAKIEAHFPPLSDEVILVKMYDEVALRKDFDDLLLVVGDPKESVPRWINLKTGELVIKDFNKTSKRYGELRHILSPRVLDLIRQVSPTRKYLFTLKTETLFKKMQSVVPKIGSQLLRKSKVSTATEGNKILDPKIRHELWNQMKHSPETQLTYRREIEE